MDEDKLVSCPFNPTHKVVQSSLQRHVLRCMVNYPNFVTCPYNALHRFKTEELLADHMLKCDSKSKAHLFYELEGEPLKEPKTCCTVDSFEAFNLEYEDWDRE